MAKRKCTICKTEFEKQRPLQVVCSPKCAAVYQAKQKEKSRLKMERERRRKERAEIMVRKRALESIGELTKKAQAAFNRYIRLRDKGLPCISCGAPYREGFGGKFDAGHYRSTGSAAHLRFDEANCHGQCVRCNRYLSGNAVAYRTGLIDRVGLAEVERIEADNTPRKWDKDELRDIAKRYRDKAKGLA